MKSLEEVIKYKLNFLPKEIEPFYGIQTYTAERGTDPPPSFYEIYRTKNPVFFNDSYSFMEDITPLFIYISSCDKYYRENSHGKIDDILIKLMNEDYEVLDFGSSYSRDLETYDEFELHRIFRLKRSRNNFFSRVGYYTRYTKPFKILFRGGFNHILTEEERLQRDAEMREAEEAYYREEGYYEEDYYEGEDYDGRVEERRVEERRVEAGLSINDSRTFKLGECVICLEKEPNVLFCECGNICICEKCNKIRKLNVCPTCRAKIKF